MPFPYLYDPTGLLPANAITDELHHVAPPVDLDRANFIVPRAAPYFATGLVIRTGVTVGSPTLVEGVDYIYTHHFVEASQHLSTPVYGSIMFLNRAYVGDVYVSYHTLGGAYTLDDYGVVETLTRSLYNIRTVTWDQLIGVPALFPVVPHPHDVADLTGMSEVVTALTNIITAIQGNAGNIGSLMSTLINHIDGISSHNKAQVGLPYLENYGMAGTPELTTRPTNKYVSPAWVWQAIELFNLGEAGVSQASDTVVGITRYATDVEVADQDNPLDNVAVSAAGMWLAIATNTERLAGATIVTGVDFNTPPYREDGYWAFTNAINTSITPSSGYISTKKAGTKAYQTETLDNGEISNRMYTGTTWTPWIRAYVATYYGTLPVTTLNGSVDLNDYLTPGFYTFDTHNVIGHTPPSFGVASEYEMMVYASTDTTTQYGGDYYQVVRNITANISAFRSFTAFTTPPSVYWENSGWIVIDNLTHVEPANTDIDDLIVTGVYLIRSGDGMVIEVKTSPTTGEIVVVRTSPGVLVGTEYPPSILTWRRAMGSTTKVFDPFGAYATRLRFANLDNLSVTHVAGTSIVNNHYFTLTDHVTGLPPLLALVDKFYIVEWIVDAKTSYGIFTHGARQWMHPSFEIYRQSISNWSRYSLPVPGCNFSIWKLYLSANLTTEIDATSIAIDDQLPGVLYYTFHDEPSLGYYTLEYTYIVESDVGLVQLGWYSTGVNNTNSTFKFYKIKSPTTGVWTSAISY